MSASTTEGPDEEQTNAGETNAREAGAGEANGDTSAAARNEEPEGAMSMAVAQSGDDGPPPGAEVASAHDGRPKKPMLAAAAIVGAVLIAVPFVLAGGEDKKQTTAQEQTHEQSDTILGAGAPSKAGDFVTESPSASPSAHPSKASSSPSASAAGVPAKPKTEPSAASKASPTPTHTLSKTTVHQRPVWTSTSVSAPSTLSAGESWRTNRIRLIMQTDGNLVVYNENNNATWAAMTFGANHKARFQEDGNLVILNAEDKPIWAAGSYGHEGAKLILRADGKVVIVDGGTVVWST